VFFVSFVSFVSFVVQGSWLTRGDAAADYIFSNRCIMRTHMWLTRNTA